MSIQFEQFDDSRKVLVSLKGQIIIADLVSQFQQLAKQQTSSPDDLNIIWDFSQASIDNLSFELIDQISEIILGDSNINTQTGRSAYVINQRAEKHLLNYLLNCLEYGGYGRDVRLFHNVEQAKKYLGFPED